MIYLDHNATTPVDRDVVEAMLPYLGARFGNPSSGHPLGRQARQAVDQARIEVAALFNGDPAGVVFTSCGTEASNLALRGTRRGHAVSTTLEHPATALPLRERDVSWVEAQEHGAVRAADVLSAVRDDTVLVSVMHANNETGAVNPVARIAQELPDSVVFHVDAAQSLGKIPVSVEGVDLLTVAGHKLYAPKGIGALWVRPGVELTPLMHGGGQEGGLRPGTENVPYIVGLGAACTLAARRLESDGNRISALRDRLYAALRAEIPGLQRNGTPGLPNTLNLRFPGCLGSAVLANAPEIAASTGSACHDGEHRPSAVLLAMGIEPHQALGAVRLSLGRSTSDADIDAAIPILVRAWRTVS